MKVASNAKPARVRKSSRVKVQQHRERMRALGMKPITIWVPDVNSPVFAAEAERQSMAVAREPHEAENVAFVDSVADELFRDIEDEEKRRDDEAR